MGIVNCLSFMLRNTLNIRVVKQFLFVSLKRSQQCKIVSLLTRTICVHGGSTKTLQMLQIPSSLQSCHSITTSPSASMWIHSKFNFVGELPSTFCNPRSNSQCITRYRWIALSCVLIVAIVWDDASIGCIGWPYTMRMPSE